MSHQLVSCLPSWERKQLAKRNNHVFPKLCQILNIFSRGKLVDMTYSERILEPKVSLQDSDPGVSMASAQFQPWYHIAIPMWCLCVSMYLSFFLRDFSENRKIFLEVAKVPIAFVLVLIPGGYEQSTCYEFTIRAPELFLNPSCYSLKIRLCLCDRIFLERRKGMGLLGREKSSKMGICQ